MSDSYDVGLPPDATIVAFEAPIAPLRVPVPASPEDDPASKGPFVLAFKDEDTWLAAWHGCEVKVAQECQVGARLGCSIGATKACKAPWWQMALPFLKRSGVGSEDREACEQAHMQGCLADAQEKCAVYARDICKESFGDARVANTGSSFFESGYRHVKRSSGQDTVWSNGE